MGIAEGEEWEPWAGLGGNAAESVRAVAENSRIARAQARAAVEPGFGPRHTGAIG